MGREAQLGQIEWVTKPGRLNEKLIFWHINIYVKELEQTTASLSLTCHYASVFYSFILFKKGTPECRLPIFS